MRSSHGKNLLAVWAFCLALAVTGQGRPAEPRGVNGQPEPKTIRIVSDPMPVVPAQPMVAQPPPGPPVLKVGVGQVIRLSATGDTPENLEKMAFLWQIPTGLSSKVDSNGRDVYLAASAEGTYRVTTIVAKNGTPRPEISLYETIIQVGPGTVKPDDPIKNGLTESQQKKLLVLTDKIRTATAGLPAGPKGDIGRDYLAMAKFLEENPNATGDQENRKLNELLQPHQTPDHLKVVVQTVALLEAEIANLGQIPRKHVYRAMAAGLGITQ
jgi:hypothetical protein